MILIALLKWNPKLEANVKYLLDLAWSVLLPRILSLGCARLWVVDFGLARLRSTTLDSIDDSDLQLTVPSLYCSQRLSGLQSTGSSLDDSIWIALNLCELGSTTPYFVLTKAGSMLRLLHKIFPKTIFF